MRNIKFILLLTVMAVMFGCGGDSSDGSNIVPLSSVTITTKAPTLSNDNTIMNTGGILSSEFENMGSFGAGVCYSITPNPTIQDQISQSNNMVVNFTTEITPISFGATYYLRAYVRNFSTNEVKYGNEVTFQVPSPLTTGIVKNISTTGFTVDVNVSTALASNIERGVCYSTSQNPTVDNSDLQSGTTGSGVFTINVVPPTGFPFYYVSSNTNYYLRSYVKIGNFYYYGNQVTFRTAGYIGGSGGFVFFDKGETTNGWRYLESAPIYLTASNSSYFQWSNSACGYTFLNGIGTAIGDGANNTTLIKNFCNYTNIAATMCRVTSLNGQTDWFLPSIDEAKELYKLKFTGLININGDFVSSSQLSDSLCFAVNSSTGNSYTASKSSGYNAWQVRRF